MKLPIQETLNGDQHNGISNGPYDNTALVTNGFETNGVMHNTINGTTMSNGDSPCTETSPISSMSSVFNGPASSNGAISQLSNGIASGACTSSNNSTGENSPTTELQPFYTPQLQIKSPTHSYFSVLTSQDSIDVYHDASGSLQRARLNSSGANHMKARPQARRRHASASTTNTNTPDLSTTAGILALSSKEPRVRYYSCSSTEADSNNKAKDKKIGKLSGTPVHIGRLSLSTHSLKLRAERESQCSISSPKFKQRNSQLTIKLTEPTTQPTENIVTELLGVKTPDNSTLTVQSTSVAVQTCRSYSPHIDMPYMDADSMRSNRLLGPSSQLSSRVRLSGCNSSSSVWRNNYITSLETEQMLQRSWSSWNTLQGGNTLQQVQDIQVCPQGSTGKHDAEVTMYTFGPVQRRRVGLQRVKEEFRRENLYLEHKAPHLFVASQWQQHNRMSCMYLGYRLFWAMYFLMWTFWAFAGSFGYQAPLTLKAYHFMYMTNWGLWMLTFDVNLQAFNTIRHFKKLANDGDASYPRMPFWHKVSWAVSNITGTVHLFITLAYWITVYPNRSDEHLNEIGFNTHLIQGLYVLLDVCVSATPRRLLHAYWPMLFICCYLTFNVTYYLAGGLDYLGRPAIYPTMDWTKPGMTIPLMAAVVLVVIPMIHGMICALYAVRVKLWRILKISRYVREEDETEKVNETPAQEEKV